MNHLYKNNSYKWYSGNDSEEVYPKVTVIIFIKCKINIFSLNKQIKQYIFFPNGYLNKLINNLRIVEHLVPLIIFQHQQFGL